MLKERFFYLIKSYNDQSKLRIINNNIKCYNFYLSRNLVISINNFYKDLNLINKVNNIIKSE